MFEIEKMRKKLMDKTKTDVKEALSSNELPIIKSVNLIDDLDLVFNLLSEQCREWYSLYFPELTKQVQDFSYYLKLVANITEKKHFTEKEILKYYNNEEKAKKIAEIAKTSIGADLKKEDLLPIKSLAERCVALKEQRTELENFLTEKTNEIMPNTSKLLGNILAAKFLAKAGSLRRLALMSSSTIQVLGAEKAFFSFLKTGSNPPKYGLLFQMPVVNQARADLRGGMARTASGKLSIALKEDFFGKKDISKKLIDDLAERALDLSKQKVKTKRKTDFLQKQHDSFRKARSGENFDKPRRSFGRDDQRFERPNNFGDSRKKFRNERSFDKPRRSFDDSRSFDKPRRSFDEPAKKFSDFSNPRKNFGAFDKPRRSFDDSRSFDKPRRNFDDSERNFDRPRSFENNSRFGRKSFGDSDRGNFPRKRFDENDRGAFPRKKFGDERPRRAFGHDESFSRKRFSENDDYEKSGSRNSFKKRTDKPLSWVKKRRR